MENADAGKIALVGSVLHPTDFSPASDRAFAHALAIALLRQTEFTILHVGSGKESDVEWSRFPPVRKTLERWGLLEPGSPRSAVFDEFRVRVRKIAASGRRPMQEAAAMVDDYMPDLIVLATEGRDGWARWFNRSDAEAIARWSKTMSLFVPADARRGLVSLENGDLTLKNILVPVDAVPDCTAAVEFARRTAEMLVEGNVNITLLHIGDDAPPTLNLVEGAGWTFISQQRQGDPVAEILSAADSQAADLIVMATAGHDGVLDALRGTTTEQVLRAAPCPLLAVPAGH